MQFKDVVGHAEIKAMLGNKVQQSQVPHALLFLGQLGRGGLPLAWAFVQYLMCESRTVTDSCGSCRNCERIAKMEHPDVHFSFPTVQTLSKTAEGQFSIWKEAVLSDPLINLNDWITLSDEKGRKPILSVWESEAIIKKLNLTSFEGGYKVYVIWCAEEMHPVCANKLLKIIEEPPKNTVFLLVSASENKILPTILSRTQIQKIKPIEDEVIIDYLENKKGMASELANSIVARSNGNLATVKRLSSSSDENIYFSYFIELMRSSYKKNVINMLNWADTVSKLGRENQKQFINYSIYMVRQSLMKNYTANQLAQTAEEEEQFLANFARFITGNNVLDFYKLFNEAHYNIERNAHGKLLFTNLTFEVMRYIHRA